MSIGFMKIVDEAIIEAHKAIKKFPQPNYVALKVAEESGEVIKAAAHCAEGRESYKELRGEIVQNIAMLYRLVCEGDQVIGLKPLNTQLTKPN